MNQLKIIDAHAHIHGEEYNNDRNEVLLRMNESGVGCITVGTSLNDSKSAVELASNNDNIWATIGIHPNDTEEIFNEKDFEELVKNPKVVAIGECGLDYYRIKTNDAGFNIEVEKKRQKENFLKQLLFAIKHNKPLMIHCRPSDKTNDAHEDMLDILNSYITSHNSPLRGNIHFFTGSKEIAERYFDLGFTVSIPGVVTFARDVAKVVKELPIDKILVETDCPYATPVPFRGKRNEPIYVLETARKIGELKEISLEEVTSKTLINTIKTFTLHL